MSPGTVREYVVRLRRLGIIYTSKIFPSISCRVVSLMKPRPVAAHHQHQQLPHRITEVQHYQRQTCTGLVQKSSSLPVLIYIK